MSFLLLGFIFPQRNGAKRKSSGFFATIRIAIVVSAFTATSAHPEKIRTAIPQAKLNYLSIFVADARGFFRDEGLDNETVVISGPFSIAALLSGDVDFSGAGGSGMRAALKGAPLKGIYFQSEKVTFYLVVDPSIKSACLDCRPPRASEIFSNTKLKFRLA